MKKFIKKYYIEILCIILPILIFLISNITNHFYPFGDKTLLLYDAKSQYPGFLSYYREVLLNRQSLFYSFKGILGYNFYATAAYYLFNPSNILILLFNNDKQIIFCTILIYLRISLSSFTMCKYLKYKFKKENKNIILISLAYSLMAYNVIYFYNFMFFDGVVLFPLVIIGLEKLLKENNPKIYIISLTLAILSNFYIGYMICIFSLIYYIYIYYLYENKNKKQIKMFIISSALSGLICTVVLLPTIYELLQGKAELFTNNETLNYFKFNINFLNIFYKIMPGSFNVSDVKYGTVNIYITLFSAIQSIKYFFNKNINKKEKKASLIIVLFFLLSISFNLIDYTWHMFQRPIYYPNRYIFVFSFFLLTLAYKQLINNNKEIKSTIKIVIFISIILLSIYPATNAEFYNSTIKIISMLFSTMLIMQYIFNNNKKILIILFSIEIIFNTIISLENLETGLYNEYYLINHKIFKEKTNIIKNNEPKNNFYRVEYDTYNNYNNGATYSYNGLNFFNSLKNSKTIHFLRDKLEYDIKDDSILVYTFENPYINSLLGIKYFSASNQEDYYTILNKDKYIYKNSDALPLIFKTSDKIKKTTLIDNDRYGNVDKIIKSITDNNLNTYYKLKETKLENIKIKNNKIIKIDNEKDSCITYNYTIKEKGFLYINNKIKFTGDIKIKINGENKSYYFNSNKTSMFLNKGDIINITIKPIINNYNYSINEIIFMPYNTYKTFIESIDKSFKITEYKKDNVIKGIITETKNNEIYLTTIPYDKGWNIKINNKKLKFYDICLDTFICFKTNKNAKNIELSYTPVGFKIGLIISSISLVLSIIYIIKINKSSKII